MATDVPMTATKPFHYARRSLKVGDAFEATEKHARVLVLIGKAKPRTVYAGLDLSSATKDTATAVSKPKRAYKRRDLTAE